jgi:Zn-dependent protease
MEERNQYLPPPPGAGQLPPPPPIYPVTADIPPQSPQHYSSTPGTGKSRGLAGGLLAALAAAWAYGKYVLLLAFKVPALATVGSALISLVAYAFVLRSAWVAVGLVLMIFVHEMGHVAEIRRQGMQATAPIFIPFVGAAIFQRSHPTSAIKQAQIGIAGPIAGTLGATAALVLFGSTHWIYFLVWAYYGFLINLFNLIPFGMLDGGWILAPVSKWIQVAGLAVLVGLFVTQLVSPLVIILFIIGIPMVVQRFRDRALDARLTSGPAGPRFAIGAAWLALVLLLGVGLYQTEAIMQTLVR